jgi:hypothetical protein
MLSLTKESGLHDGVMWSIFELVLKGYIQEKQDG